MDGLAAFGTRAGTRGRGAGAVVRTGASECGARAEGGGRGYGATALHRRRDLDTLDVRVIRAVGDEWESAEIGVERWDDPRLICRARR